MYLKRWYVICLPDRVIFANDPHYNIAINKTRPCLVISLVANKIICIPFTEKLKLTNFELSILNKNNQKLHLKLLSFFQVNIRHPDIVKVHKIKIPKEDRQLLTYIWNEILTINYEQKDNQDNLILEGNEAKSSLSGRIDKFSK